VGGNLVHHPDKVSTPTVDLSTVKLLIKSVISTPGARFATFDLKDFYMGTPMARKEYMCIHIASIPKSIIDQYALADKAHKGLVLVKISKGMYGLPQVGILAFNQLKSHITTHDYDPCITVLMVRTTLVDGRSDYHIGNKLHGELLHIIIYTAIHLMTISLKNFLIIYPNEKLRQIWVDVMAMNHYLTGISIWSFLEHLMTLTILLRS
jgi:hypothetical protein